ncbi:MAG TPA: insulinase family protein, partial [Anaeromyxobacteraceae bacterium]
AFRLFDELREIRGLNYGDYAYPEHFVQAPGGALPEVNHPRSHQEFTVWIRPVEPPHRLFAIRAALYEIDRWAKQGLTQGELDRVKQFLAGYTLTFDQTDSRKLGYALDDRFYGLERPWLETVRARLAALKLEEVNAALRRHVDPVRLRIVVATHGAAELEAVTDKETTVFAGRCPKEALERFLPILLDVVRRPRFDPQEVERLRSRAIDAIAKGLRTESDEELGKEALSLSIYGGHPYGHFTGGTVQGLKSITADDIKAHWRRVFTLARLSLGAAGGYEGDLPARLAQELSGLPAGSPRATLPAPVTAAPRFLLVEKTSPATAISMGFTWDVRRGDPDFPALVVAVSALGEHRQGAAFRLFDELREIRGLNYGDYAYPEHFVQAPGGALPEVNHPRSHQEFTVWIRPVEPPHRLFTIRAALYEIDRWRREGLTQEELDRVKRFLAGYTLTFDQTDSRKLGYALDDRFYGLERPWLETLRARIAALKLEEVNAALRRHVDPVRLRIVVATHGAAELAAELRKGAPSPITYAVP